MAQTEIPPLLLDSRIGSIGLLPWLTDNGTPVQVTKLEFADAALYGHGPAGSTISEGVEIKALGDMLSCIQNSRDVEQLRGMKDMYQRVRFLVIGDLPNVEYVKFGGRTWTCEMVWGHLFSLEEQAGVRAWWCKTLPEAARWLKALWVWWAKEWDEHRTLMGWKSDEPEPARQEDDPTFSMFRPTQAMRFAAALYRVGVGPNKAVEVGRHFGTAEKLVLASEKEWAEVPGIGKGIAKKVWNAMRSEK